MESQRFEDSFREAFYGAEIIPSDSVWSNIEQDLEKNSGKKGLLLLIQLLAAASLLYAMGVTGTYYLHKPQFEKSQPVALNTYEAPSRDKDETSRAERTSSAKPPATNEYSKLKAITAELVGIMPKEEFKETAIIEMVEVNTAGIKNESDFELATQPLLRETKQPQFAQPISTEPDPGAVLLSRLKDEERKYQPKKKRSSEKLWTSIGVGAGSFNPSSSTSTTSSPSMKTLSSASTTTSASPSMGMSYSIGFSLATRVTDRIVLQGGISYLSQNAEFTSSTAVMESRVALNEHADATEEVTTTSPYKVRSASQYMSIPIQAGYVIIDQDFAVQLNGGISTDFFIQNTLTPENDNERIIHRSGTDSPYRTINFSGLLGTELSYKVGDNYRIALNPGLRYALNSIYKSEVATEVSPVTFDVALRFRYIFK